MMIGVKRAKILTDFYGVNLSVIGRATEIFRQDDFGISLAEHYRPGIYYERNRALVDHSSELICYHDGGKGGTKYTVDFAIRNNLSVHNLYGVDRL